MRLGNRFILSSVLHGFAILVGGGGFRKLLVLILGEKAQELAMSGLLCVAGHRAVRVDNAEKLARGDRGLCCPGEVHGCGLASCKFNRNLLRGKPTKLSLGVPTLSTFLYFWCKC